MHQTVNLTAQAYGGSNPSIPIYFMAYCGSSSVGLEHLPSKQRVAGSSPVSRFCPGSSVVEHILGKDEVGGSIPLLG
tara:strand:- start:2089 stop:2319 length:231 start_codon:yes stop_codon:yes gene_type:complete